MYSLLPPAYAIRSVYLRVHRKNESLLLRYLLNSKSFCLLSASVIFSVNLLTQKNNQKKAKRSPNTVRIEYIKNK